MRDTRACRPISDVPLESCHRVGAALGEDLDAAIHQIAHPSADAFPHSGLLREVSEPDALHASAHDIPSRDRWCLVCHEPSYSVLFTVATTKARTSSISIFAAAHG
jgi:hypothetical protein